MATAGIPPGGVQMLSSYLNVNGSGGFALCETDNGGTLASWVVDRNGLIESKVTAIVDDKTVGGFWGHELKPANLIKTIS